MNQWQRKGVYLQWVTTDQCLVRSISGAVSWDSSVKLSQSKAVIYKTKSRDLHHFIDFAEIVLTNGKVMDVELVAVFLCLLI